MSISEFHLKGATEVSGIYTLHPMHTILTNFECERIRMIFYSLKQPMLRIKSPA
jgi:hypothetical protein